MSFELFSTVYSITTKIIVLYLIVLIIPTVMQQFAIKRHMRIKWSMSVLAYVTVIAILPVIYYQLLGLMGVPNRQLLPLVSIAASTVPLTVAGVMYIIYKVKD